MLGMDPVLTGSLCFLVLAIVMYVKFIREHPMVDDDDVHHHHHVDRHGRPKARKSSPIEPDSVPFLHPSSPVSVMQPQPQKKQPLSPRQGIPPQHHGLAVLQKAQQHQYKNNGPSYYNQQKQPMRRRAHSAANNNNNNNNASSMLGATAVAAAPSTMVDPELGLAAMYGVGGDSMTYEHHHASVDAPRSSHRIDFGDMAFDQEAGFYRPQNAESKADDELGPQGDDDLESRLPALSPSQPLHQRPPFHAGAASPAPFMIGDLDRPVLDAATPLPTPAKPDAKPSTTATERPFAKDSIPQPAQMQLEVAKKARIPLFLHSPMYVKTSAPLLDSTAVGQDAGAGAAVVDPGGANMTSRKKDKLPPRCHKNNSLHIDFNELKVGEMIGQGAFGTVHKATWRGTTVAVKILVCQYLTADILEEFETEVQIMSILRYVHVAFDCYIVLPLLIERSLFCCRHPNICLLMGACLEPPSRCLVIEYLPRGSLWNVLRQEHHFEYSKQTMYVVAEL
ncbi:hypothetical protein PINS_up013515 [Pythium insidiosum]|nr:hypothetical protein PINS_up013515 [Pythium insidiosum]